VAKSGRPGDRRTLARSAEGAVRDDLLERSLWQEASRRILSLTLNVRASLRFTVPEARSAAQPGPREGEQRGAEARFPSNAGRLNSWPNRWRRASDLGCAIRDILPEGGDGQGLGNLDRNRRAFNRQRRESIVKPQWMSLSSMAEGETS